MLLLSIIDDLINQLVTGMSACTLCLMIVCVAVWYTVVIVSGCWHALSDYIVYAQTDLN